LCAGQKAVEQVAKNENPDHIFALWALPSGYWARKTSIPYSIWALGSDIWTLGRIPIIKQYLRNVIRNSQNRFADGFLLADDVKAISGLDCQFLPSSRNLVSKGKKSLSTHPPYRLAFLGRWHSNKGIDLLLDSLQLLQKEDWEKIEEVQICGGGPLKYVVEKAVKQMKSKHLPVSLHGYLNKEEAIELLTWADYLLLPSRIESIPVIFSDALQCNCPVIGSPVGDVPRLISDYQVGVLAKETSTNAFKNAIKSALKKPPAMFTNGLKQARHLFNIDEAAGRFLKTL
jgi:glycosyltransferase involved in cell wall biosynthesis